MQSSNIMSIENLMTLEEGHGKAVDIEKSCDLTKAQTESTAVASSPTVTSISKSIWRKFLSR